MRLFRVILTRERTVYESCEQLVEAEDEHEAIKVAKQEVYESDWEEDDSEAGSPTAVSSLEVKDS